MELDNRIQNLIQKAAKTQGFENIDIKTEAGSAIGDNYLGIITKVTVTEKSTKRQANFIMKTATLNSDYRRLLPLPELYAREIFFYTDIVSTYNNLLAEYNLPGLNITPRILAFDLEVPEVFIMNDMKMEGYTMHDRAIPLDIHHVKLVMKEYGKFHGLHYALRAKHPDICSNLADKMSEAFFHKLDADNPILKNDMDMQHDKVFKALQSEDTVIALEKVKEFSKNSRDIVLKSLEAKAAGRYAVFNHGDGWVNNMLFRYFQNSSKPSALCLLDFQLARIGSPALDLSYFIFTCTDKVLRDQYYDEMMHIYHDTMGIILENFQLDVNDFLTFEELEQQMRQFSVFGLYMTFAVLHLMLSDTSEIPDYQNMEINEDSKECLDTMFYVSKNEEMYRTRIRDVVLDFVDKRYL